MEQPIKFKKYIKKEPIDPKNNTNIADASVYDQEITEQNKYQTITQ